MISRRTAAQLVMALESALALLESTHHYDPENRAHCAYCWAIERGRIARDAYLAELNELSKGGDV